MINWYEEKKPDKSIKVKEPKPLFITVYTYGASRTIVYVGKTMCSELEASNKEKLLFGVDAERRAFVIKASRDKGFELKPVSNKRGGKGVDGSKALRKWFIDNNINGRYILTYNENEDWYEATPCPE